MDTPLSIDTYTPFRRHSPVPGFLMAIILLGRLSATSSCDDDHFHCPHRSSQQCLPRSDRCLQPATSSSCIDPSSGEEPKCFYAPGKGFEIWRFKTNLLSSLSSSSRKKRGLRPRHEGIFYRGFDYEFGRSYQDGQELDILATDYKYKHGKKGYKLYKLVGYSWCSRAQAVSGMRKWTYNKKYKLIKCNCQHFADYFGGYLESGCTNRKRRAADPPCPCSVASSNTTAAVGVRSDNSAAGRDFPVNSALIAVIASVVAVKGLLV